MKKDTWDYPTTVISITDDKGNLELFTLTDKKGKSRKKPVLTFHSVTGPIAEVIEIWDNNLYLAEFFAAIKKKRKTEYHRQLKKICLKIDVEYKFARKELLKLYKHSLKLKFWEK